MFEDRSDEPVYNTRAVVQRTRVPADTFRAWERRYGVPRPSRTPGNQRLYSDRDIATIAWLRDQTETGMTISQAVHLFRADDGATARFAGPVAVPGRREGTGGSGADPAFARYREEVLESLTRFEAARADRAVEEALALGSVEDVCLHVLQPVLVEVGERWERGKLSVSTEHYTTAFVLRKLGALFNLSRPDAGRGPILAACLEGELHELGPLLTCLFLSRRGYRIVYLGANLPLPDLIAAVDRVRPALVLLSTSTSEGSERLIAAAHVMIERTRVTPQPNGKQGGASHAPQVGFGGRVFGNDPPLRARVPGIYLGADADEAIATVERLLFGAA